MTAFVQLCVLPLTYSQSPHVARPTYSLNQLYNSNFFLGQCSNVAHYLIFLQHYLSSKLLLMQKCEFLQTFLFASPTQFCDIVSIQQIFNRTQSSDPLFWLPDSLIAFQWVATIKHGGELTESEGFWHFYVSCCEESDWQHSAQQPTVTVNIKCCVRKNLNIVTLYISDIVTIWYFIAMGIFVTPSCCDSWDWDTSRPGSGHVSWRLVTTLSWALAGSRRTSLMSKLGSAFPNYICPNAGKGQSKSNQVI